MYACRFYAGDMKLCLLRRIADVTRCCKGCQSRADEISTMHDRCRCNACCFFPGAVTMSCIHLSRYFICFLASSISSRLTPTCLGSTSPLCKLNCHVTFSTSLCVCALCRGWKLYRLPVPFRCNILPTTKPLGTHGNKWFCFWTLYRDRFY